MAYNALDLLLITVMTVTLGGILYENLRRVVSQYFGSDDREHEV